MKSTVLPKTIVERMQAAQELLKVELPWEVKRVFPEIALSEISVSFCEQGDYVSLEEMQPVLDWLEENFRLPKKKKK